MRRASNLIKRAYFYRKNNSPFLSGDVFADNADVQVYPPRYRTSNPTRREVSDARIIFCPSGMVSNFFQDYKGSINAKILVFGNGDEEFSSFDFQIPSSVRKIYIQNLMFTEDKFHVLPIGLENIRLIRNGFPKNFSPDAQVKFDKILIGPFSQTHQSRKILQETNYGQEFFFQQREFLSPREYFSLASKYKFVASPRGNGIDTHRFWETLYFGNLPVIESSPWSKNLQMLDINFLLTEDWSNQGLLEALRKWEEKPNISKANEDLWFSAWREKFKADL